MVMWHKKLTSLNIIMIRMKSIFLPDFRLGETTKISHNENNLVTIYNNSFVSIQDYGI